MNFHLAFTASIILSGFLITSIETVCELENGSCNPNYLNHNMNTKPEYTVEVNNMTECMRECDGIPKLCHMTFDIEPYTVMGPACGNCPYNKTACFDPGCVPADGFEKGVLMINRIIPSPSIQVCQGDKVVVDVINSDDHRSTSVHWHGIRQLGTQFSDGVPMVTQCPINPGERFRYTFIAVDDGTFFYHTHSGIQNIDGLTGPLIARKERSKEIFGQLYDYDLFEHVIFVQDWIHISADQKIPGLQTGPESGALPKTYLINGRGIYIEGCSDPKQLISVAFSPRQPPLSEFKVRSGRRYRFRLIGSIGLACTVRITIQGHPMTVIHSDGASSVNPTKVDGVTLNSGDRFDVIIEANQEIASYWILARGQSFCNNDMQLAVLRYEGAKQIPDSHLPLEVPNGVILNPTNPTCNNSKEVCMSQLSSPILAPPQTFYETKTERLILKFGFHVYTKRELFQSRINYPYFEPAMSLLERAQINNISNKFPPSPLLSQFDDIPQNAFCDSKCYEGGGVDCRCLNIYKVKLGSIVDIIVADTDTYSKDGLMHPFHLHGHNFYILKVGVFNNGISDGIREINEWLDKGGMQTRQDAIRKDTTGVPSGGYVVLRLLAVNPGYWLFHCHFTLHLILGMSAILQVGEVNQLPLPPADFPKCGDFV